MTEPSTSRELDFNELGQLISRELDDALGGYSPSSDAGRKLHIDSVRVRLGQLEPPAEPSVEGVSVSPAVPPPFLLVGRYAPARQGWMFEIEYAAGPAPPRARGPDGRWVSLPLPPKPPALLVFRDMTVKAIKGVDSKWAPRFEKAGVRTVSQLKLLSRTKVADLVRSTRSRLPVELHLRAQLLDVEIPDIPASPVDSQRLLQLVGKPPEELRKLIGESQLSATSSEQLWDLLSLLFSAIQGPVLDRITLEQLRTTSVDE